MANAPFMPVAKPDLKALLDRVQYDTSRSINCVLAGKIVSFDAASNTASVAVQLKTRKANGLDESFPVLSDCPVFILSGGNTHVSMPIVAGDYCLVLFHDRDMDAWWASGVAMPPMSNRAHSLSDGIVLVGITPKTDPITLASNPGIKSTDKTVEISGVGANVIAGSGKVVIKNDLYTLKTLMDELFTAINAITVTCAAAGSPSGIPLNAATFTTLKDKFDTLFNAS